MENFPGEKEVMRLDNDRLILTNYRLQYWAGNTYMSIRLENVIYIRVTTQSKPIFLKIGFMLGVLSVLCCFYMYGLDGVKLGMAIAFIIIPISAIPYFFIEYQALYFGSAAGAINLTMGYAYGPDCRTFVQLTENSIHNLKSTIHEKITIH